MSGINSIAIVIVVAIALVVGVGAFFLLDVDLPDILSLLNPGDQNVTDDGNVVIDNNLVIPDRNIIIDDDVNRILTNIQDQILKDSITACYLMDRRLDVDDCLIDLAESNHESSLCNILELRSAQGCFESVAIYNNDAGICLKINTAEREHECITGIASTTRNAELCDLIISYDGTSIAKDSCYNRVSGENPDYYSCQKINTIDERDECFLEIAKNNADEKACQYVSSTLVYGEFRRDDCYIEIFNLTQEEELCEKIISQEREDACYLEIAVLNNDADYCKTLDEELHDNCIDTIARGLGDYLLCARINDTVLANTCVNDIIEGDQTLQSCPIIPNIVERNACYKSLALSELDSEICGYIEGDFGEIDDCYLTISIDTSSGELCEMITVNNHSARDECFMAHALEISDPILCEGIFLPDNYVDCFSELAYKIGNIELCRTPEKETFIGLSYQVEFECYYDYARLSESSSDCLFIRDIVYQAECTEEIEALE